MSLFFLIFAEIGAGFVRTSFSMGEPTPGIEICIAIFSGRVGRDGLIINVTDIPGGSAIGTHALLNSSSVQLR